MVETSKIVLRNLLITHYKDFASWLARRLGSADLAEDALQDTFLRLERDNELGDIRNPKAYLRRMAINIATNRRIADNRRLSISETDILLELADETPDPARAMEARSEIEAMKRALLELPARRRDIFLASWVDGIPHQDIAQRFGISVRTVQIELKAALEHCAIRLGREKNIRE